MNSAMIAANKPSQEAKLETPEVSNEEPKKKIIKLSEEDANNLDPLKYFSRFLDIPEMILQQLKGKDLINLSAASPNCYSYIASSKDLMEKIKVVFSGERELHQEDYDLLKNSSRKYQNIEVRQSYNGRHPRAPPIRSISNSELNFFLSKAHDWKNVWINETYFFNEFDFHKFLSSIESSVENLSVINKRFNYFRNGIEWDYKVLKFPKLKSLKMNFCKGSYLDEMYSKFLKDSVAIEKLELDDKYFTRAEHGSLTKILEDFVQNKRLEELSRLALIRHQSLLLEQEMALFRMRTNFY